MVENEKVTVERLASECDPSFPEFYRIYLDSIPERERKCESLIAAMAGREDYEVLILKQNSTVAGFSITFAPPGESFCLLEYMAIHSPWRSSGLGSLLLQRTVEHVQLSRGPVPMLVEVDSEREEAADRSVRRRRKDFYRRSGCLQIGELSFNLPLPGEGAPPEMDLMIWLPRQRTLIPKAQLHRWLSVIYEQVYECPADDPRIAVMMRSPTDPARLF